MCPAMQYCDVITNPRWRTAAILKIAKYDMIRYDSVYLTCSKKLTGSQLSLPHGINKKLKCETKKKMMSVIGPFD